MAGSKNTEQFFHKWIKRELREARFRAYTITVFALVIDFLIALPILIAVVLSGFNHIVARLFYYLFLIIGLAFFTIANVLAIGFLLLVAFRAYKGVKLDWKKFTPPYEEELFFYSKKDSNYSYYKFNRQNGMAYASAFLNIALIIILFAIYELSSRFESRLLEFINTFRDRFNTSGFEDFLAFILRLNKDSLASFSPSDFIGYASIILAGILGLIAILNLSYIVKKSVKTFSSNINDEPLLEGFSNTLGTIASEWVAINRLIDRTVHHLIRGDLKKEFAHFLVSLLWLAVSSLPILILMSSG